MLFWELIKTAFNGIVSHKLRSLLTMLGIIIGIGSVITMLSLGEGAKVSITSSIKSLGTNLLFVRPGNQKNRGIQSGSAQTLKIEDVQAIQNSISNITYAIPECSRNYQVKYFNKNVSTSIIGVTSHYAEVRNYKVETGRFITDTDDRIFNRVCVIGKSVQTELFGSINPVGMTIKIKGVSHEVIGLLEEKGQSGMMNNDDLIFVPLNVYQKKLAGTENLQSIVIQVADEKYMTEVQEEIEKLLRLRHRILSTEDSDFNIRSQAEFISQMNEISKMLTYLLAGVASVSLLVGGIGIMNIMLVSVSERTREIGIRKAIGAKKTDILLQFLLESIIVSLTGGILGILTGWGLSVIASNLAGFPTVISSNSIILSFSFSFAIGLFFGIYPANKAANLRPIEALRYE